jgi:hypothetical protein
MSKEVIIGLGRRVFMKKNVICVVALTLCIALLSSCATPTQSRTYEGATAGGALGAIAGAMIDRHNSWRGAVIGGALGAALGGITTEISSRAAREATQTRQPVAYQSTDGWQKVQAEPVAYNAQTNCHKVREKIWQDGQLVKDEVREVCEGEKTEQTY